LPTRFVTAISKYYNGSDLRFFFAGQLLSNFNDTAGLTGQATATSIDGASTVVFGLLNGVPTVAPQRPVRAQGGFLQLGLPHARGEPRRGAAALPRDSELHDARRALGTRRDLYLLARHDARASEEASVLAHVSGRFGRASYTRLWRQQE